MKSMMQMPKKLQKEKICKEAKNQERVKIAWLNAIL
jgi:hypothetical protein